MQARRCDHLNPAGLSALLAVAAAVVAGGCGVGTGSGSATGFLWIEGCQEGKSFGTQDAPKAFELEPSFFAGEPIGDISSGPPQNRLIIRMQRTGNAVEINDTLYFDIPSSYQVARCLRGAYTDTGEPDWDTGTGTTNPAYTMPWCEQNGPNGKTRINLVPFGPVRASLAPLATCHMTSAGPTVVSIIAVAKGGWIEFEGFGGAPTPNVPPASRPPIDPNFQVQYEDRLDASFDLVLDDDRTQTAIYKMIDVPPQPQVEGTLQGFFDFDLKRGRSAQTFP